MAANPGKTEMLNLALFKLQGATDSGTQGIWTDIDDTVFASPSTATGSSKETIRIACLLYPRVLKRAIREIRPKFAQKYADTGERIRVTLDNTNLFEMADWDLMFNLPSDYLEFVQQIEEADKSVGVEATVITANSYAHVVTGDDDQAYYCDTDHTSTSAATDGKPLTNDVNGNWTLFNTDGTEGVTWVAGKAYKASETGKLLLSKAYSNIDGDAAYIEYLGYAATGFADIPEQYDEQFVDAFTTLFASELAPFQSAATQRPILRAEYEQLARARAEGIGKRPDYEQKYVSWLEARNI